MFRVAICDDEEYLVNQLKIYVERYFREINTQCHIQTFPDGPQLVDGYLSGANKFDIILLDIKMKSLDGDAAAKLIREFDNDVVIIFISSWTDYAIFGYEVNAHRFIPKGSDDLYADISSALNSAVKAITARYKSILISSKNTAVKLELHKIMYIEIFDKTLEIHMLDDNHSAHMKLSDMEESLKGTRIIRCHRSYLVNLEYVDIVKSEYLVLTDKTQIPIGATRRKAVLDMFTRFIGGGQL